MPVRSQRSTSDLQTERAKSVFRGHRDPYFPHNNGKGSRHLPTSDDYVFRIQVISTTANIKTDVFKKAVQGLVKICFPQDVLEEIGIQVVTQHMRNEDAPESNIAQMTEIFRSEMIHRVTWMLAEYLDTPNKVEASVKAIMAASASLHGARIGTDVLGDITTSLQRLREWAPDNSTEQLSNSTDMETLPFSTPDLEVAQRNSGVSAFVGQHETGPALARETEGASEDQREPPRKPKHKSKKRKADDLDEETNTSDKVNGHQDHAIDSQGSQNLVHHSREGKEGKISTSWRWNLEEGASLQDMAARFKRTSDLFAYHALPIFKRRLGPQAKRKEVRLEMQAVLTRMSDEEFQKWVESFEKLVDGDTSMLERTPPSLASASQHNTSVTPVPVVTHSRATKTTRLRAVDDASNNEYTGVGGIPVTANAVVKHEAGVYSNAVDIRTVSSLVETSASREDDDKSSNKETGSVRASFNVRSRDLILTNTVGPKAALNPNNQSSLGT
ncbi:hypothetical protein N0V95_005499 [Ascochyta clinopodiicola]|nr:hypothetical protein N0V95_005499 [Ascochyta clinopodiicola]